MTDQSRRRIEKKKEFLVPVYYSIISIFDGYRFHICSCVEPLERSCLPFVNVLCFDQPMITTDQVRELIRQRDADGLTFFMHAANSVGGVSRRVVGPNELGMEAEEETKIGPSPSDELRPAFDRRMLMRRRTATTRDFTDFANAAALGFDLRQSSKHLSEMPVPIAAAGERVDHAVPVVKAALAFLRESLWKEEVRT